MIYLFLDTNILLHFKPIDQINWTALVGGEYRIVIAPMVIDELDKKKYDQRGKIANKAKRLLSDFEKALERNDEKILFPYISVSSTDFETHSLQPQQQDDHLILSLYNFSKRQVDDDCRLVTNDTGPKFKAKRLGLALQVLPAEYLLPPEVDETAKENVELKKEIQRLNHRVPKVKLTFADDNEKTAFRLPLSMPDLQSYLKPKILLNHHQHKLMPEREKDPFKNPAILIETVSQARNSLNSYYIEKYNKSLIEYRTHFEEYLTELYKEELRNSLSIALTFKLSSIGNTPAEDLDVIFEFPKDVIIIEEKNLPASPKEPEVPELDDFNAISLAAAIGPFNFKSTEKLSLRDLGESEIIKGDPQKVKFHLEQLKHGQDSKLRKLFIQFPDSASIRNFSICYKIQISNLTTEIEGKLNVIASQLN